VEIETGKVEGTMTGRALHMIQEWRILHKNELIDDWDRAKQNKHLMKIKPLE
jgi:hypothetical protein